MNKLPAAAAMLALSIFSSCAPGCGYDRRFLQLRGGAPAELSGSGAENTAVQAELITLMTSRVYDPGTYMEYGSCGKENKSRINNGPVTSYNFTPADLEQYPAPPEAQGGGNGEGSYYTMSFTLPEGPQLTVKFIYDHGQRLLLEVRNKNGPSESSETTVAECHLQGSLAGQPVDLSFRQELHGVVNANPFRGIF